MAATIVRPLVAMLLVEPQAQVYASKPMLKYTLVTQNTSPPSQIVLLPCLSPEHLLFSI